ncbi:MAG: glycosyltransferase family 4 protein [Candidatus Thorarchaeota archaeon]
MNERSYFKLNIIALILKLNTLLIKFLNIKILRGIQEILLGLNAKVVFIVEKYDWAIEWVGKFITENLKKQNLIKAEVTTLTFFKNKIFHFGSINCFLNKEGLINVKGGNKVVLTWFHINPEDERLKFLPILKEKVDCLHTSSLITRNQLVELGFNKDKIVVLPIGVDLNIFKIFNERKKNFFKSKYKIPQNKVIVGSFQKDGAGWGDGLVPKLIKGPDILCEVIQKLTKKFDIHVFLTGPSRGYVKKQLDEYKIPYTHIFLKDYKDIVECYNVLDLYLITSRAEGGPQALLEAMSTGVPVVSTKVGMVPELIQNGVNGFITEIEEVDKLYEYSYRIISDPVLKTKIITNGLKKIKSYSWEKIAKRYYHSIYLNLLKELNSDPN